jgi:hypothetical protein
MKIIYTNSEGGVSVIMPTGELSIEEVAAKDVPQSVAYEIVEDNVIPTDRTFRNAWVANGKTIEVNLDKAKEISHSIRRQLRDAEFAPYDDAIVKQIPNEAETAEAARVLIREKYAQVQVAIDAAQDVDGLKAALNL